MITPSFSLTATERVLPKLALDFTTASLDPRITFTRSLNTATVVNSSGYVASINANLPRFDYNPVTKLCNGLLIEEARTNIVQSSTYVANTYGWSNGVVGTGTITSVSTANPAGTTTDVYNIAGLDGSSYVTVASSIISSSNSYTASIFVKNNGGAKFQLRLIFQTGGTYKAYGAEYTFSNGAWQDGPAGTNAPASRTATDFGNGWYRFTITGADNATGNTQALFSFFGKATTTDYNYYIWGAQLEAGAFATSYIPTTSAALTRNADVAVMTGTNFSDWYNQTAGTFEAEFIKYVVNTDGRLWWIDDGSINNVITMSASAGGKLYLEGLSGGAYSGNIQNGTLVANTTMKACVAYSNATTEAASLAAASTTTGNLTLPSSGLTRAAIGYQASIVGTYFNGWIRKMNYYPQRLTNNEVQAFSKG